MAEEEVDWTVELEVRLFHAMRKHKPVETVPTTGTGVISTGLPKHFQMACIQEKLNSSISQHISAEKIWKHLATMYDLQALDNSEKIPFQNKLTEFSLPKDEYENMIAKDFPRSELDYGLKNSEGKDRDRHGSGSSSRSISKIDKIEKLQKAQLTAELLSEKPSEDTPPKRDARKRTRNSLQSPAVDNTPPSATSGTKRQRRI